MRRIRARLTYANVMSSIAVFMVLGGSAYAAATLPSHSVGSKQLKANAVTSSKVKNRSLLAKDFKKGQLKAGPQGPKGDIGPQGPKGDTGTVDTSNFFTKSQSDGRYAPASGVGNSRIITGLDFNTIISTTTWDTAGFLGKFETGGLQYLYAPVNTIPVGAAITSVDFYVKNAAAGTTQLFLSQGTPSSGSEFFNATATTSTVSPGIQTVTVTPSSPITYGTGTEPLLFWLPPATNNNFVVYGARVHFNPPAA